MRPLVAPGMRSMAPASVVIRTVIVAAGLAIERGELLWRDGQFIFVADLGNLLRRRVNRS